MNEYGPYVLQLIAADLDPQMTCAALKLCENTLKDTIASRRRDLLKFGNEYRNYE